MLELLKPGRPGYLLLILGALVCGCVLPSGYAAKKSSSESTEYLGGVRYVSLQKWARAKDFKIIWDGKSRDFIVTNNKWAKLELTINSKKAVLNGTDIYLSSSIESSGSTLYISERDVYKLIHPIFYPVRSKNKVRTIAIAPGHGGKDPGYMLKNRQEKTYTLLMAKALKEALEDSGFKVIMTRSSDVFVELEEQAAIANRASADLFITIHFNAAGDSDPNGIETYCLTPEGATSTNGGRPVRRSTGNKNDSHNALLAYEVQKYLLRQTDFADRGLRRANFMVLRNIKMPGVYIEGGFLSNPGDAKKIQQASERRKMARAITTGVLVYKRLVEKK